MITTFLFDMGNVVIDFVPEYLLSTFTQDLGVIERLKYVIFAHPDWKALDHGSLSIPEGRQRLAQRLSDADRELGLSVYDSWYQTRTQNAEMAAIIADLKARNYRILLCSNAALTIHAYKDKIEAFQYFDRLYVSADLLLSKPDPEIFTHILQAEHLSAESCLFVDDLAANTQTAHDLGMYTYHYNGNASLFRRYLERVNLL